MLLDAWYPGWECRTADGQRLPVWQADSMFRAVLLPAGKQTVEFAFAAADVSPRPVDQPGFTRPAGSLWRGDGRSVPAQGAAGPTRDRGLQNP